MCLYFMFKRGLLPMVTRVTLADSDVGAHHRRPAMRTAFRLVVLALTSALAALVLTTPASAATTPYCGITWGSLDKASNDGAGGYVDDVRSGQHACYDRLVIDITGSSTYHDWQVGYVPRVTEDASG